MQVRNITIAALAALSALLLVGLVLKARSDRQIEIDDEALAAAKAAHQRRQARSAEPSYTPNLRRPSRPERPTRPERTEPEPDRTASEPRPERLPMGRLRPAPSEPEVEIGDTPRSLAARMDAANSLYDRANYEAAQEAALVILDEQPRNVRMLRIVVSTACIMAEPGKAREYYDLLPDRDQRQMARRCARYGVEF